MLISTLSVAFASTSTTTTNRISLILKHLSGSVLTIVFDLKSQSQTVTAFYPTVPWGEWIPVQIFER